ncbi:MAG: motility associated factor glycosyltransferase family protein [Lachnospirales bacterium]
MKLEILDTISGEKTLKIDGRYVSSKYYPSGVAENFIRCNINKNTKLVILFGLGLGYEAVRLCRENNDIAVIIYEPSKKLVDYYEEKYEKAKYNIHIVKEINDFLEEVELSVNLIDSTEFTFIVSPAYVKVYPEDVKLFYETKKKCYDNAYGSFLTMMTEGVKWSATYLKNIDEILDSHLFINYKKEMVGKPVIIVGAGPSLNKNVHLLKEAKKSCYIICCNTAYKKLREIGIEPDFVAALDPNDSLATPYLETGIDAPLMYFEQANNSLVKLGKRKFLYTSTTDMFKDILPIDKSELFESNGPCIISNAVGMCSSYRMNPIILIGQDMAYTGGKNHADGTGKDCKGIYEALKNKKAYEVVGQDGNMIESSKIFSRTIKIIEKYVEKYKETTFINATEGGANVKGFKNMALKDVINEYNTPLVKKIDEFFENNKKIGETEQGVTIYRYLREKVLEARRTMMVCTEMIELNISLDVYDLKNPKSQDEADEINNILEEIDLKNKERLALLKSFEAFKLIHYNEIAYYLVSNQKKIVDLDGLEKDLAINRIIANMFTMFMGNLVVTMTTSIVEIEKSHGYSYKDLEKDFIKNINERLESVIESVKNGNLEEV